MKSAMYPLGSAFRVRIRPDLAARVVPGFPWNRDAWLAHRKLVLERMERIQEFPV